MHQWPGKNHPWPPSRAPNGRAPELHPIRSEKSRHVYFAACTILLRLRKCQKIINKKIRNKTKCIATVIFRLLNNEQTGATNTATMKREKEKGERPKSYLVVNFEAARGLVPGRSKPCARSLFLWLSSSLRKILFRSDDSRRIREMESKCESQWNRDRNNRETKRTRGRRSTVCMSCVSHPSDKSYS